MYSILLVIIKIWSWLWSYICVCLTRFTLALELGRGVLPELLWCVEYTFFVQWWAKTLKHNIVHYINRIACEGVGSQLGSTWTETGSVKTWATLQRVRLLLYCIYIVYEELLMVEPTERLLWHILTRFNYGYSRSTSLHRMQHPLDSRVHPIRMSMLTLSNWTSKAVEEGGWWVPLSPPSHWQANAG